MSRLHNRYIASHPGKWRRETNQERTHYICRGHFDPAPNSIELLADEAVHHLRSILDQLFSSILENYTKKPAFNSNFPILLEEPTTEKAIRAFNDSLKGIPSDSGARQFIVDLQPYKRGNAAHTHPLWLLNRLDNLFKHSSLHLIVFAMNYPMLPGMIVNQFGQPLDSGDVFAEVPGHVNVQKDFEPYISAFPVFRADRIRAQGAAMPINALDGIYNFVRQEVLGKVIRGRLPPPLP